MKVRSRYVLVMAVAWGSCLLVAMASYAAILRPQWDYRKGLEAKVARNKEQYARALQAAREKDQSRLATEVESLHQRIGDFVLSLEETPNLAFKIGSLANEAKLEALGMRPTNRSGPEPPSTEEHVTEKHVDLSFSASFRRFAAFLNALERHRPVLFVETFTISRPAEKNLEPQASMELAVLVEKTARSTEELR